MTKRDTSAEFPMTRIEIDDDFDGELDEDDEDEFEDEDTDEDEDEDEEDEDDADTEPWQVSARMIPAKFWPMLDFRVLICLDWPGFPSSTKLD